MLNTEEFLENDENIRVRSTYNSTSNHDEILGNIRCVTLYDLCYYCNPNGNYTFKITLMDSDKLNYEKIKEHLMSVFKITKDNGLKKNIIKDIEFYMTNTDGNRLKLTALRVTSEEIKIFLSGLKDIVQAMQG